MDSSNTSSDIKPLNVTPFLVATSAISVLVTIFAIGMLLAIIIQTVKNSVNVNVLNIQTLEYQAAKNFRGILPNVYNYTYFSVTPVLQLLPLIILFIIYRRRKSQDPNFSIQLGPIHYVLLLVLLTHSIVCIMLNNLLVWGRPSKPITTVRNRIKEFNTTIHSFMYKGVVAASSSSNPDEDEKPTSPAALGIPTNKESAIKAMEMVSGTTCITTPGSAIAFYCPLRTVLPDKASQYDQVKKALQTLPDDISTEDLAKALFTVSLYLHFNKLGSRNDYTADAVSLFSPIKLLVAQLFTPADFLFSNSTFIDSKTFEFALSSTSTYLPEKIMKNKDLLVKASVLNEKYITIANNKANNLFVRDAKKPFIILGFNIVIVQLIIPIILAFIIFQVVKHNLLTKFFDWIRANYSLLFSQKSV